MPFFYLFNATMSLFYIYLYISIPCLHTFSGPLSSHAMMVGRKRPRRASFALTDEDLYHDDDVADGNPSNESVLNVHHDPSPPPSSPPRNNNSNNNNSRRSRSRQNGFKRQMLDVWASCTELLQLASKLPYHRMSIVQTGESLQMR